MTAKTEQFVFCVDSDGCAMDTMTYKHQLFFGPLAADYFAVADQASFLKEWDRINLYSRTRGVNRFVGLVMGLEYAGVTGIDALKQWYNTLPHYPISLWRRSFLSVLVMTCKRPWTGQMR